MIRKARHGAQSNIGYYGDFVSRLPPGFAETGKAVLQVIGPP